MVEVVAALIWDNDKFMICQRPENKSRALLWEFVGGKVEPGETKEQALIRECKEELDVTLSVGEIFMDVIHRYPDINVHLTLFNASILEGVPQKLEHNDIKWITVSEINNYEFCPADKEILEKLLINNSCSSLSISAKASAAKSFGNSLNKRGIFSLVTPFNIKAISIGFNAFITSLIAPRLLKALVASNGINILFASPLATSSKASKDFN